MTKDAYYFPHDFNAHTDPKIIRLIMEGHDLYGLYWVLIEKLHDNGGYLDLDLPALSFAMHAESERIEHLINDFNLFFVEDGKITSNRVLENLKRRAEKTQKARESANTRWGVDANALRTQSEGNARKERKGKERKVNNGASPLEAEFLDYFNLKTGKNLGMNTTRRDLITARLKDYPMEKLKQAVDNFIKDTWPDRQKYMDVVYCIGVRNKVDNLERWLNFKPQEAWIKP